MILKSLKLRNIRSYVNEQLSFPSGSVLLAGDIGSGKSTILHAAEFALFGVRRDSISGEALLRKGEARGEVEMDFDVGGRSIIIKRGLKRQGSSVAQEAGYILENGRRTDGTPTELKARVIDILGYPKESLTKSKMPVYRYTVYTPQEEMKQILFDDPESRVDTLRRIFGIDKYKRLSDNSLVFVKWIKDKKKELTGIVYDIDEKKKSLAERKEELETAKQKRTLLVPQVESARSRKLEKKKETDLTEEKVKKLEELNHKLSVFDARMEEIIKQRSHNNEEIARNNKEIAQIQDQIETLQEEKKLFKEKGFPEKEEVESRIRSLEQEISETQERKAKLQERQKQLTTQSEQITTMEGHRPSEQDILQKENLCRQMIEDIKDKRLISEELEELNERIRSNDAKIAEHKAHVQNASKLKEQITALSKCPTCQQEVPSSHKQTIIDREDAKMQRLEEEVLKINSQKKEVIAKLNMLSEKMDELASKEQQIAVMKVEITNMRRAEVELKDLAEKKKKINEEKANIMMTLASMSSEYLEQKKTKLAEKKDILSELNKQELLQQRIEQQKKALTEKNQRKELLEQLQDKLKKEVQQINMEKVSVNSEINSLAGAGDTHARLKKELDALLDEEQKLEIRLAEINKELEGVEKFVLLLEKEVFEKEKSVTLLSRLNAMQEWIEKMFVNTMASIEKQVLAQVYNQFSEVFSTWFDMLITDENISVRIDDTFAPIVTQNGYDVELSHLSGGEKTSVALAYRLALNKVVNDVISSIKTKDLLILDEPTDGFSDAQLDKVREVLDELKVKQTIIVSHESKIESFVDNVVRIVKEDHVSRVV